MTFDMQSHPSEDVLEKYSLGQLPGSALDGVEEHVLVCERCQDLIVQEDAFIKEIKTACREQRWKQQPARVGFWERLLAVPRPLLAGACAALLLAVVLPVAQYRSSSVTPSSVTWDTTVRGADSPSVSRAGRPLHLEIGLSELSPAGSYRIEMVNSNGGAVWSGTPRLEKTKLVADAAGSFHAGLYWVRLYGANRVPIREFGLQLK